MFSLSKAAALERISHGYTRTLSRSWRSLGDRRRLAQVAQPLSQGEAMKNGRNIKAVREMEVRPTVQGRGLLATIELRCDDNRLWQVNGEVAERSPATKPADPVAKS